MDTYLTNTINLTFLSLLYHCVTCIISQVTVYVSVCFWNVLLHWSICLIHVPIPYYFNCTGLIFGNVSCSDFLPSSSWLPWLDSPFQLSIFLCLLAFHIFPFYELSVRSSGNELVTLYILISIRSFCIRKYTPYLSNIVISIVF